MRTFLRTGLLVAMVWLQLSGVSLAKQVFLRDGSVLDCQSFWKHNNEIIVKVNRDVILQFEPAEVDLGKTFRKSRNSQVKRKHHAGKKHALAVAAPAAGASATGAPTAATKETTKPLPPTAPANAQASAPAPAAKQLAEKPAPSGPNPAASAPVAAAPATPVPAANPPAAEPAAKESTPAESAPSTPADPAPAQPLSKEELQRRTQENTKMIANAIRNHDAALMKKAIEAQKSLIQQQQQISSGAVSGAAKGKGEPPWFKYFLMLAASGLFIIIGMWVVFQKAGEPGYKSIIPIYNCYVLMQISGKPGWWLAVIMFVPVIGFALLLLAMLSLAEKFNRSPVFGIGLTFLPMIFFPLLAFGGSQYAETVHEELDFTFSEEPPAA
jgi:hypothetical protein